MKDHDGPLVVTVSDVDGNVLDSLEVGRDDFYLLCNGTASVTNRQVFESKTRGRTHIFTLKIPLREKVKEEA